MRIIGLKPKYENVVLIRNNKPIFKGNFIEAQEKYSRMFVVDISNADDKKIAYITIVADGKEFLKTCL